MASDIINRLKKQLIVMILIIVTMGIGLTISMTYNYKHYKQTAEILEAYDADIPRTDIKAYNRRKGKK